MFDNLSIAVRAFHLRILTSLSVDEILLPRYTKWSSYFRGLSFNVEMSPASRVNKNNDYMPIRT